MHKIAEPILKFVASKAANGAGVVQRTKVTICPTIFILIYYQVTNKLINFKKHLNYAFNLIAFNI